MSVTGGAEGLALNEPRPAAKQTWR